MYLIVETVHQECEGDKPEWRTMRQTFRAELGRSLGSLGSLEAKMRGPVPPPVALILLCYL